MTQPPGYIDAIWQAVQAGALSWDEARQLQDRIYDPCDNHSDRPGKAVVGQNRYCEECLNHEWPALKLRRDLGIPI